MQFSALVKFSIRLLLNICPTWEPVLPTLKGFPTNVCNHCGYPF